MPRHRTIAESAWRRRVLELATFLAEEALAPDLFERFLAMLARDFPGSSAVLDYDAGQKIGEFAGWEVDTEAKRAYSDHFHAVNPYRTAIVGNRLYNGTYIGSRWVHHHDLLRTEFYNDWMRPRGDRYFVVLSVGFPDGSRTGVPIYRGEAEGSDWTGDDARRLDMLRPFVQNAILLRRLYRRYRSSSSPAIDPENIQLPIIASVGGKRTACNDAGERHLSANRASQDEQRVHLRPNPSSPELVIPPMPCNPKAVFARRHGLSKREAEVAVLLVEGLSYREVAAQLQISFHTVNSHVKSLLRKLNLSSTRRLAALLGSMK